MRRNDLQRAMLCVLPLLILATPVHAQSRIAHDFWVVDSTRVVSVDSTVLRFARGLVAAVNSQDKSARRALMHPRSWPCVDRDAYFARLVAEQSREVITPSFRTTLIEIRPEDVPPFTGRVVYAVRPTHTLKLDYDLGPGDMRTFVVQLVHERGKWFEVFPCPTAETLRVLNDPEAAKQAATERAKLVISQTPPSIREEVVKLVRAGRRADAEARLQSLHRVSPAIIREALDILLSPPD